MDVVLKKVSVVWFGKHLQVVKTGLSYHVYNGDLCLTPNGFVSKSDAILRAHELQDEFFPFS